MSSVGDRPAAFIVVLSLADALIRQSLGEKFAEHAALCAMIWK
jgi:hypothetical protein